MTGIHTKKEGCLGNCHVKKPCPFEKFLLELDKRSENLKSNPLGVKHLDWVKKMIPLANGDNNCIWVLSVIYLFFSKRQKDARLKIHSAKPSDSIAEKISRGRNEAEEEIVKLLNEKEVRQKIFDLLNLKTHEF